MKKITALVVSAFLFTSGVYAADLESLKAEPTVDADGMIQLNNALCPISGDELVKESSPFKYEGVVYRLCCLMCSGKLTKNPDRYAISAKTKDGIIGA